VTEPRRYCSLDGLVLRKTSYSESSWIVALLTPDAGQQHVFLKGARRSGKKNFPDVDHFRCLRITYRPSRQGGLHTARDSECLESFDGIAAIPMHFQTASWICRFAISNTVVADPAPQLYKSIHSAFRRLASDEPILCLPVVIGIGFVALTENGLMPGFREPNGPATEVRQMVSCALSADAPYPEYSKATWRNLADWLHDFLLGNGLKVPENLERIT